MKTHNFWGRLRSLFHLLSLTFWLLLSSFGSSFQNGSAAALSAGADAPAHIVYSLNAAGQPVEEPQACIQQGAVFTHTDLFLGTLVPSTGDVVDGAGRVVGYVRAASDSP